MNASRSIASGVLCLALAPSARAQEAHPPADTLPATLPADVPFGLPPEMGALLAADPEPLVELGRALFFDSSLSIDRSIACASCHEPEHGFASPSPLSRGVLGRTTERNAPSLVNRALGSAFMWDGRVPTLEEQVLLPIENEREMGLTLDEALERLASDERRAAAFDAATGSAPSREGMARALAAFVRRLTLGDSPYDHFLHGRFDALTPDERGGLWIFESRGRCWRCHRPPLFTDEGFHATGVGAREGTPEPGRMAITHAEEDLGRFKTPTLRGLVASGPYMHDGSIDTLAAVVERYRHIEPCANLDPALEPLEITDEEAALLVAFLAVLSRRIEDTER
jgi:cytochrome c peroxidase